MLTEYHTREMATLAERTKRNALKFGTTGEVDSQKGLAHAEGLLLVLLPPPNCIEVGSPQVELDGAVGGALVQQPPLQRVRTKLIFDVRIDNPFLY